MAAAAVAGGFLIGSLVGALLGSSNSTETDSKISETVNNHIEQSILQNCQIDDFKDISGITVNITNSRVGDIEIGIDDIDAYRGSQSQDSSKGMGSCYLDSALSGSIINSQKSMADQTDSTTKGFFGLFGSTSAKSKATGELAVTNFLKQFISNSCTIDKSEKIENVVLTIKDSTVGNETILIRAPTTGSCNLAATAKFEISNDQASTVKQKAISDTSLGGLLIMIIIIVALCVGGGFLVAISQGFLGRKKTFQGSQTKNAGSSDNGPRR